MTAENATDPPTSWWARGMLFENCVCQVVCPGHVHFDQDCTHERCLGYWAIRFDQGEYEDTTLAGIKAVIAYDSPQHMIDGGWTETIIIDTAASERQRAAVETILRGDAGGPWQVLGRFVDTRLDTRFAAITIEETDKTKTVKVDGILESTVEDIRGRDRDAPVRFENMFNQIHDSSQVIARGSMDYDDGQLAFKSDGTHALHSHFSWSVGRG